MYSYEDRIRGRQALHQVREKDRTDHLSVGLPDQEFAKELVSGIRTES